MDKTLILMGIVIVLALSMATYFTYVERKILAFMQLRKGPNVVGWFGLLQPIADAIKAITKEFLIPKNANKFLFVLAPIIVFSSSFLGFMVIPYDRDLVIADMEYGLLFILLVGLIGFIGMMIAGVYSYSNYAKISAIRIIGQFIAFEIPLVTVFLVLALSAGSLNLSVIVNAQAGMWNIVTHFPLFLVFLIVIMMETSRTPFDIPQAESEIVSGYQAEYSGLAFSYFMFFEYMSMLFLAFLTSTLFLGGWYGFGFLPGYAWLIMKSAVISVLFIWLRATLPRLRFDQTLRLGFVYLAPLAFLWFLIVAGVKALW